MNTYTPDLRYCNYCQMSYYQTSAPHVCAGWAGDAKEKRNMSERYYLRAGYQTNWTEVTKEQFIEAEQAAGFRSKFGPGHLATGGFHGRGVRGKIEYKQTEETPPTTEHEPVARGGESEWRADSSGGWGYVWQGGACLAKCPEPSRAEQIVTEHNQHHSLLADREKLRTAAQAALDNLYERSLTRKHWSTYDQKVYEQLDAALNDQKGE